VARILIVDDDAAFREALTAMLQSMGHDVLEAADGNAALAIYRGSAKATIDAVICDIFMPGKEGFETIRDLRCDSPSARIIAMSAGDSKQRMDVFKIALRMGASTTLRKPFDREELGDALGRALLVVS
jgi:two-component system chemotaxis response regulator CheY